MGPFFPCLRNRPTDKVLSVAGASPTKAWCRCLASMIWNGLEVRFSISVGFWFSRRVTLALSGLGSLSPLTLLPNKGACGMGARNSGQLRQKARATFGEVSSTWQRPLVMG